MESSTKDIFFHCEKCGSILNEADFEFNQNKTHVCAKCTIGQGNLSVYLERKEFSGRYYLLLSFCWLFPYFLWGEIIYRIFLSQLFFFQEHLTSFPLIGDWIGLALDIVLMLIGGAAVICAFFCIIKGKLTPLIDETYAISTTDIHGKTWTDYRTVHHYMDNFFIILWNIVKFLFVCAISFLGIIILTVTIIVQRAKIKKEGIWLNRHERALCARYKKILKEKNKRCTKYTIFSDAELYRRIANRESVIIKETISVEGVKYFICGLDNQNHIYLLARPYANQVEYKFLVHMYFIENDEKYNMFIPYLNDKDMAAKESRYFPIPPQAILEYKKFLSFHHGKSKKL